MLEQTRTAPGGRAEGGTADGRSPQRRLGLSSSPGQSTRFRSMSLQLDIIAFHQLLGHDKNEFFVTLDVAVPLSIVWNTDEPQGDKASCLYLDSESRISEHHRLRINERVRPVSVSVGRVMSPPLEGPECCSRSARPMRFG
jgi:hypothetical protein